MYFKRKFFKICISALFLSLTAIFYADFCQAATITAYPNTVIKSKIGGFGYEMDYLYWKSFNRARGINETNFTNVIARRWKEISPGFARVGIYVFDWEPTEGTKTWNSDGMNALIKTMTLLKETNTEVYLATWHHNNPAWLNSGATLYDSAMQDKFARTNVDLIEYLYNTRGFTNIKYYCMANELQTADGWGTLEYHLETFKSYHQKIYDELESRGLADKIKLVSTDESDNSTAYSSIDWALNNMDSISGIYGGHYYTTASPDTTSFYSGSIFTKLNKYAGLAAGKGKDFIIGEFGSQYNGGGTWTCGVRENANYGLMLAEFALAGLNTGTYAMANWDFFDFYYNSNSLMKWGTFSDVETGFRIFPHYYAYGMMAKFFRPNSAVIRSASDNSLVRAAIARNNTTGKYTIAVINRNTASQVLAVSGLSGSKSFNTYVYSAQNPPVTDGALPSSSRQVSMANGQFNDNIGANSLVIYNEIDGAVSNYPPAVPAGVRVI